MFRVLIIIFISSCLLIILGRVYTLVVNDPLLEGSSLREFTVLNKHVLDEDLVLSTTIGPIYVNDDVYYKVSNNDVYLGNVSRTSFFGYSPTMRMREIPKSLSPLKQEVSQDSLVNLPGVNFNGKVDFNDGSKIEIHNYINHE